MRINVTPAYLIYGYNSDETNDYMAYDLIGVSVPDDKDIEHEEAIQQAKDIALDYAYKISKSDIVTLVEGDSVWKWYEDNPSDDKLPLVFVCNYDFYKLSYIILMENGLMPGLNMEDRVSIGIEKHKS